MGEDARLLLLNPLQDAPVRVIGALREVWKECIGYRIPDALDTTFQVSFVTLIDILIRVWRLYHTAISTIYSVYLYCVLAEFSFVSIMFCFTLGL